MEKENDKQFLEEYQKFLNSYKSGLSNGEQIGEVIARMANYFAIANSKYGEALIAYNTVASSIEKTIDNNGKPISSAKSKILASATPESDALIRARINVESIQEIINSLKALQKGIIFEQNSVGIS